MVLLMYIRKYVTSLFKTLHRILILLRVKGKLLIIVYKSRPHFFSLNSSPIDLYIICFFSQKHSVFQISTWLISFPPKLLLKCYLKFKFQLKLQFIPPLWLFWSSSLVFIFLCHTHFLAYYAIYIFIIFIICLSFSV